MHTLTRNDAAALRQSGVAAVYTPKDFELNRMVSDVLRIVERVDSHTIRFVGKDMAEVSDFIDFVDTYSADMTP